MRFWASRDMDGTRAIWAGCKPDEENGFWESDDMLLGGGYEGDLAVVFKLIFPHGTRKGQCVEIKLPRAVVVED